MEKKILWLTVVALLAVDVFLVVRGRQMSALVLDLESDAASYRAEAAYGDEQEALLNQVGSVPADFPKLTGEVAADTAVDVYLLVSVDDCTNCIEDEVSRLNMLALEPSDRVSGIWGFFVDEDRPEAVAVVRDHLAPQPVFPFAVGNPLPMLPGATTPLVLVVRSQDGRILDAHKPIPQNLTRRDAFYARWTPQLFDGPLSSDPWSSLLSQED